MIALSITLAYSVSLVFVGFLLWRRDRYRTDLASTIGKIQSQIGVLEAGRERWDEAYRFVEAQNVAKGLRIGR